MCINLLAYSLEADKSKIKVLETDEYIYAASWYDGRHHMAQGQKEWWKDVI
jgi:hypothetical protein